MILREHWLCFALNMFLFPLEKKRIFFLIGLNWIIIIILLYFIPKTPEVLFGHDNEEELIWSFESYNIFILAEYVLL